MGLALAAELNGYPEPLHALELADELSLTPDQRSSSGAALNSMKSETAALGESVIAGETALDRLQAVTPRRRYRHEARLAISE